jgi:hypothetical protein
MSSANIELEISTTSAIAIPSASTSSVATPVCGRASATISATTARPRSRDGSAPSQRLTPRPERAATSPRE